MVVVGAKDKVMDNWFPVVPKTTVRPWLMNQRSGSIGSWVPFCQKFVAAVPGQIQTPRNDENLNLVVQGPNARLCSFMQ
jgi:hypothetical protein